MTNYLSIGIIFMVVCGIPDIADKKKPLIKVLTNAFINLALWPFILAAFIIGLIRDIRK
ncbi:MAG: hypothetical protein NC489_25630 [Ruminococcus flavefaciens]|nr:hypothetical protein [Ruminococcus flavefaciens]